MPSIRAGDLGEAAKTVDRALDPRVNCVVGLSK
jgi:hypothetical protein